MADLIERASAINALQYVLDSPNYSKALCEILRIPTADTPQTDCDKCIWNVCNYNKVDWDADTPQTDCDHKCIQTEVGCEQTDCAWK